MKKFFFFILLLLLNSSMLFSQAAFNLDGSQADPSAGLEVNFPNKGFLPPRVALTSIDAASPVTSPATGLLIYNTATAGTYPNNVVPGNYYWNGTRWIAVSPPQGTSLGDMLYWNGTQWAKIPAGLNGQILVLNASVPTWGQGSINMPAITTNAVTNLSSLSAVCGGNASDGGAPITVRGVCWNLTGNPTTADSKTTDGAGSGYYTSTMTGLSPNTTYHVRAYATNSVGTSYGADVQFTTINIVTTAVTSITATSASGGGTIASDGGNPITARGVCWNTMTNPDITNFKTTNGSGIGTFTSSLTGLTGNTLYYVRAYITNGAGTFYGNEVTFTTLPVIPIISTNDTLNVTQTTAYSGGTITNDGGTPITVKGVCWNTGGSPTTSSSKTTDGTGSGSFSSYMTGLSQGTVYYVRAYATNSAGTGYGNERSFMTKGTLPTVTTIGSSGITNTQAAMQGIVNAAGVPALTERGFFWGTSPNPTILNNKLACGSGTGVFNGTLNYLMPGTTYHYRAYAASIYGTNYGADSTFTTSSGYYVGFETGWPSGWSGTWTLSTESPFEGFYCLKSNNQNDSVKISRTFSQPGTITFYHKSSDGYINQGGCVTSFYINNQLKGQIVDEGSWNQRTYTYDAGLNTFKWKNDGGGYYYNTTYIDFLICSP